LAAVDNSPLRAPHFHGVRAGIARWLDDIETGWAIPVFIVGFIAFSTLILSIGYISGNLHMDVLEAWSVGRTLAWGFWKHPPLMGWVTHGWAKVFPLTDWSFRLLAMVNAGLALLAVDLIARRFVRGDKRAVILLLLLLTPIYQFHAEKFNANSVLLAVWPLAAYCFLRSFEERTAGWAAAAGFLCALAMLGKYYSIFLLAGFVIAAILAVAAPFPAVSVCSADPHRREARRSFIQGRRAFYSHQCGLPAAAHCQPRHHAALALAGMVDESENAAVRALVAAFCVRGEFRAADPRCPHHRQRSARDMAFPGLVLYCPDRGLRLAF
jgi:hypothetical protein